MGQILLVRHGQASLGKSNYDQLSATGETQANLLGAYLRSMEFKPELIITGSMQRHIQTAEGIIQTLGADNEIPRAVNENWNEFDFESLIKSYLKGLGSDAKRPSTPAEFFAALRQALMAWSEDQIADSLPESWSTFSSRTKAALQHLLTAEQGNILVVSSGGAISMAIKHILKLDNDGMINLNLQSRNTGVTELFAKNGNCYLSTFNHVCHLSTPAHKKLITHA